jgi:hypothetical protein
LNGKLASQSEIFVRRKDIISRAIDGDGQFSAAFSTSLRYNIFEAWQVSARVDADVNSPFDSVNASGFLSGLVATSVRF